MFYIDSPPSKSLGRKEFRLDGVPLAGSAVSSAGVAHRLAVVALLGQPVLQVSAPAACLLEPLHAPDEPLCWLATCWRRVLASQSVGFSARMVVLPKTQLFKAV